MSDYRARRFAQAKAINCAAGKPIVRYSPDFDALVSWDWDGESLDELIDEAQRFAPYPDKLLANGLANGDLTKWDDSH